MHLFNSCMTAVCLVVMCSIVFHQVPHTNARPQGSRNPFLTRDGSWSRRLIQRRQMEAIMMNAIRQNEKMQNDIRQNGNIQSDIRQNGNVQNDIRQNENILSDSNSQQDNTQKGISILFHKYIDKVLTKDEIDIFDDFLDNGGLEMVKKSVESIINDLVKLISDKSHEVTEGASSQSRSLPSSSWPALNEHYGGVVPVLGLDYLVKPPSW